MRKKRIAIIGAGIGGLTLAYGLNQSHLLDVTMIAAKDSDDIRNGRLPSTQVHFNKVLQTEFRYQMANYGDVHEIMGMALWADGQRMFKGILPEKAVCIDQRIYLANLYDGLKKQGMEMIKRRVSSEDLLQLAAQFDLILDCSGKIGPVTNFPIYANLSNAPANPLRVCSAGIFHGIIPDEQNVLNYNIVPGLGEMFEGTIATKHGAARQLLLEAVPGSDLDVMKGDKGPEAFSLQMLDILKRYFPHIYKRVSIEEFGLVDNMSYLRTAIKPEVRIPYTIINSILAIGCGDSVALYDPITGQGANAASYCASVLCEMIVANSDQQWDEQLGEKYWQATQEYVTKTAEWTNAMMGPLSEPFSAMLGEAAQSQEKANVMVRLFMDPIKAHGIYFNE